MVADTSSFACISTAELVVPMAGYQDLADAENVRGSGGVMLGMAWGNDMEDGDAA